MKTASSRLLPPMGSLRCLEAAARLGSFTATADELGLTQSAVSRQIATLEEHLQAPLFHRIGRRVRLTSTGRGYAEGIGPALDRIRRVTARTLERGGGRELTVATLPSFGMRWLAPRLPRFSAGHPDVVVNFTARSVPFDFAETGYDGAIHYGLPDWPDAVHTLLFRETTAPVVSPLLLAEHKVVEPRDLLGLPLLLLQSRRRAWDRWFAAAGVGLAGPVQGAVYEQFLMVAQAAAAGAGAALVPSFLIKEELSAGTLTVPFDVTIAGEEAYWFVRPDYAVDEGLVAFERWIAGEGAREPE